MLSSFWYVRQIKNNIKNTRNYIDFLHGIMLFPSSRRSWLKKMSKKLIARITGKSRYDRNTAIHHIASIIWHSAGKQVQFTHTQSIICFYSKLPLHFCLPFLAIIMCLPLDETRRIDLLCESKQKKVFFSFLLLNKRLYMSFS